MVDETDMNPETKWFYEERARTVVTNLQKKNIGAQYVLTRTEALSAVLEMIPEGATVVRGDSVTLEQIGIMPGLKKRAQNTVIDPMERDAEGRFVATGAEKDRMLREAFFADVFLSGTNAVTLDGKLVNIDGRGNRVAPMIFGPKKVILVIGANKIVRDVDQALERIHQVAAPMNVKRHVLKHHAPDLDSLPCARTGSCIDCHHDWRICRYTVIIEGTMIQEKGKINVVLVGEELGL